ncbi:TIR domain-containing protein [Hymenobacter psychrotolerans DSM 18569]|uniref:TIR domain-containing protein n=2 Tax=Hymenobacter psychrotolerans TaxID=344998 RepID=A0A1M7DCE2_9BACT|nr:TIR domain-containing protein [Hymenobacter psychrotolerans DSM 18569]
MNIYISYNHEDAEFAREIADRLKNNGHDITFDVESLAPGQDWRKILSDGLKMADAFVALISKSAVNSSYVLSEIGAARAFAQLNGKMLVIPILLDNIDIPPVLRDIMVARSDDRNVDHTIFEIERAITAFTGARAAVEQNESEVAQKIEYNAPKYIDEAISTLKSAESRNRNLGIGWYVVGFISLVGGAVAAFFTIAEVSSMASIEWVRFALLTLKNIIVIGLLGACAKYAFTLGRSYVSEELKCSDRLHAISFGKFFLQVYGAKATWPDLKEAFQHWNIDRSSSFSSLDTSSFDPKVLESFLEVAKLVANKKDGK